MMEREARNGMELWMVHERIRKARSDARKEPRAGFQWFGCCGPYDLEYSCAAGQHRVVFQDPAAPQIHGRRRHPIVSNILTHPPTRSHAYANAHAYTNIGTLVVTVVIETLVSCLLLNLSLRMPIRPLLYICRYVNPVVPTRD